MSIVVLENQTTVREYSDLDSLARDMAHRHMEGLSCPLRAVDLAVPDQVAVIARATEIVLSNSPR